MRVILYPLSVRVWHWGQALAMLVLMLTGLQLRFPEHAALFSFKVAVRIHNVTGVLIGLGWLAWLVIYVHRKDLIRQYLVRPRDLGEAAARQVAYYAYGIFQGWPAPFHPSPQAKFNPLQKVSYMGVMFVLVPVQILTGLLLLDVNLFRPIINAVGGIRLVDGVHVFVAYSFVAFLCIHVYLSTLGTTFMSHIKAMIVGYEEEHDSPEPSAGGT